MIFHTMQGGAARRLSAALFVWAVAVFISPVAVAINPQLSFGAYVLDHWSVEQGLPQITVLNMAEDRAGFLWINTQAAIARFDGTRFVTYDRATAGVDTSMLMAAWADPHGGVWFGGAHGLLHERDGRFEALGGAAVNAIVDAGDGTPLMATEQGMERVQDGKVVALDGYTGPAFSLLRDGGIVWIGGVGRVCRRDGRVEPAVVTCIQGDKAQRPRMLVRYLAWAGGQLWLGTQAGLMRLDGDHLVSAGLGDSLDTTSIESLLTDRDGGLWIGTVEALYRRLPDKSLERVSDDEIVKRPWVQSLLEDRSGNLWLGTRARGLYRVWNGWTRRVSWREGVADPLVWSVARAPDGRLVLGTNSDVEILDGKQVRILIPGSALPNPSAYELYYDRQNRLWVGTRGGIAVFDQGRDVTPPALSALARWRIDDIREVAAGDFWIGTSGGLYHWQNGKLTRADPAASTAAAIIRSILPLAPDHLYIGTEDGVRELRNGKLTEPAWALPLRGHFVSRLAMLKPGWLGVGTADAGIGVMQAGRLRMTSKKDGLPSNNVWAFDVLAGDLYVSSSEGAWRLPLAELPRPGSSARMVSPQRLAGEQRATSLISLHCCNGGAGARSVVDGDVIWYSTTDGVLALDTHSLGALPTAPAATVVSIEHDGQQLFGSEFELDQGTRDLTINYTAPYLRIGTLQFRYLLEGYDTDWQDAGMRREVSYTHLPAGTYRFRVAATLPGAAGYGREADVVIQVKPRWYELMVVRGVAVVLLCLLLVLLVRWSMRRQRLRNAWLEEQVERRTGELSRALERLRVTNLALAQESHTDTLTSLPNRRYLMARLPAVLSGEACIGVLQIDIDYFKQINDSYGHAVGDSVLRELGSVLSALRRDSDITVRWGGEEFLLLLQDVDANGVLVIAERLRHEIAAREFKDGRGGSVRLSCSIGFSMHPLAAHVDKSTFDAALELADVALYRAKSLGRNKCVGLLVSTSLPAEILQKPLAPQLNALLASGQLRWMGPGS
ncbi:MAG TPA: diguanylate cyclase [Rhodanobacter sp.]|nr:diguanylate cyclase [Rhodanobacter sp.]